MSVLATCTCDNIRLYICCGAWNRACVRACARVCACVRVGAGGWVHVDPPPVHVRIIYSGYRGYRGYSVGVLHPLIRRTLLNFGFILKIFSRSEPMLIQSRLFAQAGVTFRQQHTRLRLHQQCDALLWPCTIIMHIDNNSYPAKEENGRYKSPTVSRAHRTIVVRT